MRDSPLSFRERVRVRAARVKEMEMNTLRQARPFTSSGGRVANRGFRPPLPLVVFCICLFIGCGSPQDGPNAPLSQSKATATSDKAVGRLLDQAIEAYGGMSAFEKSKACKVSYHTRTFMKSLPTEGESVLIEDWFKYPDKVRRTVTMPRGLETLFTSNGHNTWVRGHSGKVQSCPSPRSGDAWPPIVDRI
jgi:hypothetical protein